MINKKKYNIGFIGGGINSAVGLTHYLASQMDGFFKLKAGCFSRNFTINQKSAFEYNLEDKNRIYKNYFDLLKNEKNKLDALVILTPIPSHYQIIKDCLLSGFNIISEKALALNKEQCDELYKIAKKNNLFLIIAFNYSGYPMIREFREMIKMKKLGKINHVCIEMPQEGFLRNKVKHQKWRLIDYHLPTVSLDLGSHVFHLINFLLNNKKCKEITGHQTTYGKFSKIIDTVSCMALFDQNIFVNAWWGKAALGSRNGLKIKIFGDKGSAEWKQTNPEYLLFFDKNGTCSFLDRGCNSLFEANNKRYNRFKAGHPAGFIEAFANLYTDIYYFIDNLRTNNPVNLNKGFIFDGKHSSDGIAFLEHLSKAVKLKKWVKLSMNKNIK